MLPARGAVKRPGRDRAAGGAGDADKRIRRSLRRGIDAVIFRQTKEPRRGVRFDRAADREPNGVQLTINRL